jgi:hypothetical protein
MKEFDISKIRILPEKEYATEEQLLTGNFIKGLDPRSTIETNVELERKEYVQFPDGTTQKVVGEDHDKGGVPMSVPDGTKVISNALEPSKAQVKRLEELFDLKIGQKDTFATVIDKYTKKIGLQQLNEEQELVFKTLKTESAADRDTETARVNMGYLAKKIKSIEDRKQNLEEKRAEFFSLVFDMQEALKKPKQKEEEGIPEYKYGGVTQKNFEMIAKKYGLTPEQMQSVLNKTPQKMEEGGIVISKDKLSPTGESLTDKQKEALLSYYERVIPEYAVALRTGRIKWDTEVFNPGLVKALEEEGTPQKKPVGYQSTDKSSPLKAGTYGNLSPEEVNGFLLKDYYEKTTGKTFANITPQEIGQLQQEYNKAFSSVTGGTNYYSGAKGPTEVADSMFGNRTASYVRKMGTVKGNKEGYINVDTLFSKGLTQEQIDDQLKDYGLSYKDIEPYRNVAYKYIKISPDVVTETSSPTLTPPPLNVANTTSTNTAITDRVKVPPPQRGPQMFYTPDQSILPPSPMEAHLKANVRLERIDPVKIGIENNIQEINNERNFVASQLDSLPETQRAAVLANLLANSNKAVNQAATSANTINAQNQAAANQFNIGQSGQEELYEANNALNFEQRQMMARANTEEALRGYFDYNQRVAVTDFKNQQRLNLMNSLFPDYNLDFMGSSVNFEPNSEWTIDEQKANREQFLAGANANPNSSAKLSDKKRQEVAAQETAKLQAFLAFYNQQV